jgi:ribosome-binding protein aMBF1 (putative translation factor)
MNEQEKSRVPWATRMVFEEIATRVASAMEAKNMSLFELAEKLSWSPTKLLQWIDGSLAVPINFEDEETGTLRELVEIGRALGIQWDHIRTVYAARVKR